MWLSLVPEFKGLQDALAILLGQTRGQQQRSQYSLDCAPCNRGYERLRGGYELEAMELAGGLCHRRGRVA